MRFQVKCKHRIRKASELIICWLGVVAMCAYIATGATTPKDFIGILAFDIFTVALLGYAFLVKGGAEVVNSLSIDGENITIKRLFSPVKEIKASNVKRYTIDQKRMNKGPRREYIHLYYDDTFIELYEDNVCNFELLVDYLRENCGREF